MEPLMTVSLCFGLATTEKLKKLVSVLHPVRRMPAFTVWPDDPVPTARTALSLPIRKSKKMRPGSLGGRQDFSPHFPETGGLSSHPDPKINSEQRSLTTGQSAGWLSNVLD